MKPKGKPVICFDMDGTILDDLEAHAKSWNLAFRRNNLMPVVEDKLISMFSMTKEEILKKLYPEISGRKFEAVLKAKSEFAKNTCKYAKPITGVTSALIQLKEKYKLVLVSNLPHQDILDLLKCTSISVRIFDLIVGEDEIEHPKPAPDAILKISEYIDAKVEYMVGDTTADIKAGKAAGVKTIAVLTGVHSMEKLSTANPDLILKSVADIPEALEDLKEEKEVED